jgi:5-formyltetrahydrofolate cyclo-ligase
MATLNNMSSANKSELRTSARRTRKALIHPGFARKIARHAEQLGIVKDMVVGGYHALPDEAEPAELLARLVELGCQVAFPRVAARDQPLEFHHVSGGDVLEPGSFGIPEPLSHWPKARPGLLLVPLLAFDAHGHRLGYGGGFYDRTLALLKVPAIGIAYAGQEVASLPHDSHDAKLDAVLTECGLTRFPG